MLMLLGILSLVILDFSLFARFRVLLALLGLAHFGLQGVAGLLGIAQQHGRVGLVEDGVVHGGISHAQ